MAVALLILLPRVAGGQSDGAQIPAPPVSGATPVQTIDDVLASARTSNARLPVPAMDLAVARERVSEARAERWLKVAVEGDFIYAPPNGYDPALTNAGESRLQAVARQQIYDGGARRAAVARSEAEVDIAAARYRVAEKDLELEVRNRYAEWIQADTEADARRDGIGRLQRYRTSLESRRASGQAVGADILKIDVRLATEQASLVDAIGRREAARIALNVLAGREPGDALALAPLAAPVPSAAPIPVDPEAAPEVREAAAETRAADADLLTARAERKPHLSLTADAGFLGSDTSRLVPGDLLAMDRNATFGDRVRRDAGYSLGLFFSWPVWDAGGVRSRIRQAEMRLQSTRLNAAFRRREVSRQWAQAQATLGSVWEQIRILSGAAPASRDSYLDAESRYRGGAATSLEVLDAYAASIESAVKLSDALSRYRIAQALLLRWGTP